MPLPRGKPPREPSEAPNPDAQWIVHLGMTGRLLVTTPDSPVAPHTHARLNLASGRELRFVDPRRFGRLEFRNLRSAAAFHGPGAEPLTVGAREFASLFHARRLSIKAALLNQTLLAGVGNIYADESLFQAGIRPRRRANRLTAQELERLRLALRQVLSHAIRLGGSSVSDYVDADGERGFFQLEHCVYQRTGLPCRRCQTPIRRLVLAGRGTHYLPQVPAMNWTGLCRSKTPRLCFFEGFRHIGLPESRQVPSRHVDNSLKSIKVKNGTPIAIYMAPVMYRSAGRMSSGPEQQRAPGRNNRQRAALEREKPAGKPE